MGDTDLTGRIGVNLVEKIVLTEFEWAFREQPITDEGIDAQVETKTDGATTGRLLALQIKTGSSYFIEPKDDGWIFRFSERQARLWLGHALPVIVVLVDPKSREAYWQRLNASTVAPTGQRYKVLVPRGNTVRKAKDQWNHFASGIESQAIERYEATLQVLPPTTVGHIVEMHKENSVNAAVLALHLAEGRRSPGPTSESLLVAEPRWLEEGSNIGWRALASYAAAHEELLLSSRAFEKAAERDYPHQGKLLVAAGLNAIRDSPERSRLLLERASSFPEAELLVRLGYALLNHPKGDAGPRIVTPPFDLSSSDVLDNATLQAFLSEQAMRSGDLDNAVNHARRARELEPTNADFMCVLADALGRRSFRASVGREDVVEAVELLGGAVDQLHKWDGPTLGPLEDLLRSLALIGNHEATLRYSLLPPKGSARSDEASRPYAIRHALVAAFQLSRQELVNELAGLLGDSPRDRLDRSSVGLEILSDSEKLALWAEVADQAEASSDYQDIAAAVLHSARLGSDESFRLTQMVERGIVPRSAMELASALARAHQDLDSALPDLRALARTDISAAEYLMTLLIEAERYHEAAAACRSAYEAFRQDYFLIAEAQIYREAESWDEAESAALRAVALNGFPRDRGSLLTFLAGRAADRGDWVAAEEYLARVLPLHTETRSQDVWRLVGAQLHRAEVRRAAETIRRYSPRADTPEEATMWLQATVAVTWDQQVASEAVTLALRFADHHDLSLALLWQVISKTTTESDKAVSGEERPESKPDSRPIVPAELHKRAFAALEQHIERNPETKMVRKLQGTDQEMIEQITKALKQRHQKQGALRELLEKVRQGSVPIGLAAAGTGRSYALCLVQQSTGPLIAAAAGDEEHDLDRQAAITALGRTVVVDASSLLLSSQVAGGRSLRGQFSSLLLPTASRRDIIRAAVEVQGLAGSSGTLGWDDKAQRPAVYELSASDFLRYQRRVESLDAAASETTLRIVGAISVLPELSELEQGDSWLAPIQLTHESTSVLWSDDIGHRRLARTAGVSAFGTPALVEVLNEHAMDRLPNDADLADGIKELITERQEWVRRFIRESVVDVPANLEDLLAQAEWDDWEPRAGAVVLTRPSWWVWQRNAYNDWAVFIEAVARNKPESAPTWQHAAMLGIARTYVDGNYAAAMLAALAVLGLGAGSTEEDAAAGLQRAREVAMAENLADPLSHLPLVARALAAQGRVDDPESFTTAVVSILQPPLAIGPEGDRPSPDHA